MRLFLTALVALAISVCAEAQQLGTNMPTFVYWTPGYFETNLPWNSPGSTSSPWVPNSAIVSANGSLIGDGGYYTSAQNFQSGTYQISFSSPSPITINPGGFFSDVQLISRVNGVTTESVNLSHDGGNILAGSGWLTTSGVSSSNPLSNWQVYQSGTTPAQLTSVTQGYVSKYSGVRWMNNLSINNNISVLTSANLVPAGTNDGQNAYADIVNWTNAQASDKTCMIEIPIGAQASYIQSVAQTMSALNPGKQLIVELSSEVWNGTFSQLQYVQNIALTDPRCTNSDTFGKDAQEYGLMAAQMMATFDAAYTGKASVGGFLGSQASNLYWVDTAKSAIIKNDGASSLTSLFKYQGCGAYAGDNINDSNAPTTEAALYSYLKNDLTNRISGYVSADAADAKVSGLTEAVYEGAISGYESVPGAVSASVDAAFRASPDSEAMIESWWSTISKDVGQNGLAFYFDLDSDSWGPQENPLGPTEPEQAGIDAISASLSTPEPSIVPFLVMVCLVLARYPSSTKRRQCERVCN